MYFIFRDHSEAYSDELQMSVQNHYGLQFSRYRFDSIIISVLVGLSYLVQFLRATVYEERVQKLVIKCSKIDTAPYPDRYPCLLSFNVLALKFYNNCDKRLQWPLPIKLILRTPAYIAVGFPIKLNRYEVYVFLILNVHLNYCKLRPFSNTKELRLCSMSVKTTTNYSVQYVDALAGLKSIFNGLQWPLPIKLILRTPAYIAVGFPIKLNRYEVYVFLILNVHLNYCKLRPFSNTKELRLCSMSVKTTTNYSVEYVDALAGLKSIFNGKFHSFQPSLNCRFS
uniref:Uncharacterized protein n=1 Tax=Glossina palpalis gambiensis TaxID=67801 RepID=A0A1B0ATV6_9MUSC